MTLENIARDIALSISEMTLAIIYRIVSIIRFPLYRKIRTEGKYIGTELSVIFVFRSVKLHIGNVNVTVRSDDEGAGSNSLDLTVLAVCNSVEEVKHSADYTLVKSLYV